MNVYNLVYHSRNAAAEPEDRDSLLEIVDSGEEEADITAEPAEGAKAAFCPWCGAKIKTGFLYCHKCGKKLP